MGKRKATIISENKIIKELQTREKLMFGAPTYNRLRSITGIANDSKVAKILTGLESDGIIKRQGKGDRNIRLTEKGRAA